MEGHRDLVDVAHVGRADDARRIDVAEQGDLLLHLLLERLRGPAEEDVEERAGLLPFARLPFALLPLAARALWAVRVFEETARERQVSGKAQQEGAAEECAETPSASRATRATSKTVTPTNKAGSSSSKVSSLKAATSKTMDSTESMDVDDEMELTERTFAYEGVLDRMVETFVNAKSYTVFKKLSGVSPADVLLSETPFTTYFDVSEGSADPNAAHDAVRKVAFLLCRIKHKITVDKELSTQRKNAIKNNRINLDIFYCQRIHL